MDDLINKEYGFIIIDSLLKDETELLLNCRDVFLFSKKNIAR